MASDRPPRTFGYGRASTSKQEASPEIQKEAIRGYARLLSLGDVTMFLDPGVTAKIAWEDRPAGKELFCQLRKGDTVIIHKLDRAFRRVADCACVMEKFERLGIKLHIVNLLGGSVDLSSAMGRFTLHLLAAFAELERSFISERTREGLRSRKKRGFKHSRFPGYGFRWEKRRVDGKNITVKVADADERDVMRSILVWRSMDQPMSWDEIRDHLNYNLKLVTKDGGIWDTNRIRRACKAELILQIRESGSSNIFGLGTKKEAPNGQTS